MEWKTLMPEKNLTIKVSKKIEENTKIIFTYDET